MKASRMKTSIVIILILVSFVVSANKSSIDWQDWSPAAFASAKKQDRPMIINVGHEGCIACRWMKDETFTDPEVIKLINQNFVAVQVDSEMRPDIGEQYSDWAWPATAFNKPDGTQVLAIRGNRSPQKFISILNQIIKGHRQGNLVADQLAPYGAPSKLRDSPISIIRDQVQQQLDSNFDDRLGGWGESKILEHAEPLLDYAVRFHLQKDQTSRQRFIKTVDGFLNHLDPVWGGLFYESLGNWDDLIFEKRLETQAAGLQLYATAYYLTGEQKYSDALVSIHRYINDHLQSKDGLYFASQQANLPVPTRNISNMRLTDYYQLDDKGRREIGFPTIDRSMYTDLNARIISGLINAFEATNNEVFLNTAVQVADALILLRKSNQGNFIQFKPSKEFRYQERIHTVLSDSKVYLRPHAYLGLAFMDLHRATANKIWLDEAEGIVKVLDGLQDKNIGGFFGTKNQIVRRKPLEDNAVAARFMYLMGVLVKNESYKKIAERAIKASAAKDIVAREGRITGNLALTTRLMSAGYIEFSIVGDQNDPDAQALFYAARQVYEPRKVQHYELPGRYPKGDKAAMYICSQQACSVPIFNGKNVAAEARKFVNLF